MITVIIVDSKNSPIKLTKCFASYMWNSVVHQTPSRQLAVNQSHEFIDEFKNHL